MTNAFTYNFTVGYAVSEGLDLPDTPDAPDAPDEPDFPDEPENPITNFTIIEGNSTLNGTWLGGYYGAVDGAIGGLNGSISGVMGFGLYPIETLTSSIESINDSADDSFSYVLTTQANTALVVNSVFGAMPTPVISLFVFYLICVSILLILKGGVQK